VKKSLKQRDGRAAEPIREPRVLRRVLLTCGILSSLLYVAINVYFPMQWDGYSSTSQTVSELSAVGAPTRTLWVLLGGVYAFLIAAFGYGVWQSAQGNRPLRVVGGLLIAHGIVGLWWPPMHQRTVLEAGGGTLTDTMHIIWAIVTVLLMLLAIGFGAAAFGKRFRLYSIATIVILLAFGVLTGLDGPRVSANLSTPVVGVWERINIGAFLLWVVVLANTLLRVDNVAAVASAGKLANRLVRAVSIAGGILSFSALALGSAQFYRVSGATLGPGAFMLSIPKILGASLAPFSAVCGLVGIAFGLSALWLARGKVGFGPWLVVLGGLAAATINAAHAQLIVASSGNFAEAFGIDWQEQIPPQLKGRMLAERWTWKLSTAHGVHVERDVAFATVPGSNRRLLADVWSPPTGVAPSRLGFIYLHGGGYSAFDKGGPTELWFRHLAAQGHVVMDVAYRLIPETTVVGMQGDVKRAVAWLKRNADQYGVDPNNIVLGGGSAGSHLALLAAYAPYHPLFTPEDVRGVKLSVRGVIGYYNAGDYRPESQTAVHRTALEQTVARLLTNLLERWSTSEIAVDDAGGWDAHLFLGGRPDQWPHLYRQISPIVHVSADTPPTLQFVGEYDVYVSDSGSVSALHRKLRNARVPSVYVEFPRTDHAFDLLLPEISPAAQAAMYDVDRFLALMASDIDWSGAALSVPGGARGESWSMVE
jgi:acetyl esterase/lipase